MFHFVSRDAATGKIELRKTRREPSLAFVSDVVGGRKAPKIFSYVHLNAKRQNVSFSVCIKVKGGFKGIAVNTELKKIHSL